MKTKSNNSIRNAIANTSGFTLVEVLVVIAIMSILVALAIPQLRVLSKERGIRESARVVGSMFATTSQRAEAEGTAGVVIVRNNNMVGAGGLREAATTLYRLRAIPDYTGSNSGELAEVAMYPAVPPTLSYPVIEILEPLFNVKIRPGDYIFVGDRNTGYPIIQVEDGATFGRAGYLWLTIESRDTSINSSIQFPNLNGGREFRIQLRPQVVQSSRVDMPAGYRISLNFSGIGSVATFLGANIAPFDANNQENIAVVFKSGGAIAWYQVGNALPVVPVADLHLLITEDTLELDPATEDVLVKDDNLWVNVNKLNGATSVTSSIGQPMDGTALLERILNSRKIANTRQSATQ